MTDAHSSNSHTSYEIWELNQAFRAAAEAVMLERPELWGIPAMQKQRSYILHDATYGRFYSVIHELERMAVNTNTLRTVAILLYAPVRLPKRLHHPLPEEVNTGHL